MYKVASGLIVKDNALYEFYHLNSLYVYKTWLHKLIITRFSWPIINVLRWSDSS